MLLVQFQALYNFAARSILIRWTPAVIFLNYCSFPQFLQFSHFGFSFLIFLILCYTERGSLTWQKLILALMTFADFLTFLTFLILCYTGVSPLCPTSVVTLQKQSIYDLNDWVFCRLGCNLFQVLQNSTDNSHQVLVCNSSNTYKAMGETAQ
jgi:hypothetical protein